MAAIPATCDLDQMQKLLITLTCIASLGLTACSSAPVDRNAPTHSFLERIPIVYRQDIQQGNKLEQSAIDQLKPGMSKRQVRFLMGTPLLVDAFHQERWDYVYTMTKGWGKRQEKHVTLYFKGDRLARLVGDMHPTPGAAAQPPAKETVVSVPDWDGSGQGLLKRAFNSISHAWGSKTKASNGGSDTAEPTASGSSPAPVSGDGDTDAD